MPSKRKERELLVAVLYRLDILSLPFSEIGDSLEEEERPLRSSVLAILKDVDMIDRLIKDSLPDLDMNRLGYMERAILRLATFELTKKDLSCNIIISEALEISKRYCDLASGRFINKVLDQLNKNLSSSKL